MKILTTIYIWLIGGTYAILIALFYTHKMNKQSPDVVFPQLQKSLQRLFKILFIRINVENNNQLEVGKQYIFMPNHVSFIDVPLFGAYLPFFANALEAESHFKWRIYGKLIKAFEQIPVRRENPKSSIKSYEIAKERLKIGRSIIVFPEGHRALDGKLKNFKRLPFVFAKEAGVDIVPVGLSGVQKLSPKGTILVKPSKITIRYGEIIKYDDLKNMEIEDLMEKVRIQIINLVDDYSEDDLIKSQK
jgi:1-acyl-sn-glycerol-3-phosphate acyltransferase